MKHRTLRSACVAPVIFLMLETRAIEEIGKSCVLQLIRLGIDLISVVLLVMLQSIGSNPCWKRLCPVLIGCIRPARAGMGRTGTT